MANAEMTIRLVDATAEEQSALDTTPTFNNGGPVPPPVQTPKAEANKSTGANAKEGIATDIPASRWVDGMDKLRDAMLSLYQRFTPKAFQEPIERLINALDPRDEKGNTLVPPPVQTDVEARPLVDHIRPQTPSESEEKEKRKRVSRETDAGAVPSWVESLMRKSPIGAKALQTYQRTRRNLATAAKVAKPIANRLAGSAIGKTAASTMQKAGGFAKATVGSVAKKLGFPAASGAAASGGASTTVASGAAASAGAAGTAATGAAGSAGAGAAGGAAVSAGVAAFANPVGITVAAVAASFAVLALAAKALGDAFLTEAERLTQYSGKLAVVEANRQVNTELNMIDRAKKTEGGLASFGAASNNLNSAMEKLWTQILVIMLKMEPALTTGVNALTVLVAEAQKAAALVESNLATQQLIAAALTPDQKDDQDAAKALLEASQHLAEALSTSKSAWDELLGKVPDNVSSVQMMFADILSADLDAQGNLVKKKKHGNARGGNP
jgi:hypothetical protein